MASIDDSLEIYAIIDKTGICAIRSSVDGIMQVYKNIGSASEGMNLARIYLKNTGLKNLDENSAYLILKNDKIVERIGPSRIKEISDYERTLRLRNPCEERFMNSLEFYEIKKIELMDELQI